MRDPELISLVGHPSQKSIREAGSRERVELLAFPENRDYVAAALSGWTGVRATLHLLGDAPRLPEVSAGSVWWLAVPRR